MDNLDLPPRDDLSARRQRERERYANDPEYRRKVIDRGQAWRQENRDKSRAAARRWYDVNREREKERTRRRNANKCHNGDADQIRADLWEAQLRCCYLCEQPLDLALARIDHDHRCCPQGRSCAGCRRGVTHDRCNRLIGAADDDPELLRRIAGNLEHALAVLGVGGP